MVKYDFDNYSINPLINNDIALTLIDLIDERFHLAVIDGKIVTRSLEFVKTGIQPDRIIRTDSTEFFDLWKRGVDRYLRFFEKEFGLNSIYLIKAYWAEAATNTPDTVQLLKNNDIKANNLQLQKMYEYIETKIPDSNVIRVPESFLIADANHQWGLASFHYVNGFYEYILERVLAVSQKTVDQKNIFKIFGISLVRPFKS